MAARAEVGRCCATVRSACGTPTSTPIAPSLQSSRRPVTRTAPSGRTTSCAHEPVTPRRLPPSRRATDASRHRQALGVRQLGCNNLGYMAVYRMSGQCQVLRVSDQTREQVLRIGREEFDGASADETV